MFDHRFLAESAFRPQIGHGHLLFQRAAGRHDLGEQPGQRCSRQRPLIQFAHTAQDGLAFLKPPYLGRGFVEDMADFIVGANRNGFHLQGVNWGRDLPANRGLWNFDEIKYDYFGTGTVVFAASMPGRPMRLSRSASSRATTSGAAPAWAGTIILMGLLG